MDNEDCGERSAWYCLRLIDPPYGVKQLCLSKHAPDKEVGACFRVLCFEGCTYRQSCVRLLPMNERCVTCQWHYKCLFMK